MVDSGVPDELPKELTAGGQLRQARKNQNKLLEKLGDRLGINAITNSASQSVDQFGDTSNLRKKERQKNKMLQLKGINS